MFSKLILNSQKSYANHINNYPLTPDKIKIKREIMSDFRIKIADLHNIPISNVKKLVSNVFDEEKYVLLFQNLLLYLRLGLRKKDYITY